MVLEIASMVILWPLLETGTLIGSSPLPFTSKKLGGTNFKETPNACPEDWKLSKVENDTAV